MSELIKEAMRVGTETYLESAEFRLNCQNQYQKKLEQLSSKAIEQGDKDELIKLLKLIYKDIAKNEGDIQLFKMIKEVMFKKDED